MGDFVGNTKNRMETKEFVSSHEKNQKGMRVVTHNVKNPYIIEKALIFAVNAHNAVGQRRKYTNEPYFLHSVAVARIVSKVPHTDEMLAAALLHDTVEDTNVTLIDIERNFGNKVASLVECLTDVSKLEDGNRKIRKAIDREHTARASAQAKTIKLADLIENTHSIVAHDSDFAKVYLAEKALLLEVLRDGDATLWAMAADQLTITD